MTQIPGPAWVTEWVQGQPGPTNDNQHGKKTEVIDQRHNAFLENIRP